MPRLARLDAPGVLHHVMGRSLERTEIFLSGTDRNDFISRLAELAEDQSMVKIGDAREILKFSCELNKEKRVGLAFRYYHKTSQLHWTISL